jgi:hypothetical protein
MLQPAIVTIAVVASMASPAAQATQQPAAPEPRPANGVVLRGCLTGSNLTHIVPQDLALTLPGTLNVSSIRVIRSQLKALNGHQVELIGALRGIPGQDTGLLVVDSDQLRLYIGGGDTRLGEDLVVARYEPPTIYAQTVKDIADTCTADQPK